MASTQKITLASSRDIPFNKLTLSQNNVRRVKAGTSIEQLAESIARRGLIQSLHVRPVLDDKGKETGQYEVPAGGRRYRALELLVKQKHLAKTAPVPCVVSSTDVLIDEVSLAENIERAPLHPLDQFRAFVAMRDKGMREDEIAAAFFVDGKVVKQRLRLAAVSPQLLEVYADDGMTLEELMAFTVSPDIERQEQVWAQLKDSWQKSPHAIRRLLTETAVRASDKRTLFVGIDAYEAAGGTISRDLFQPDDGGWLQDPALLEQLVHDKLKAEAEVIAAEGWKWIEVAASFPYGHERDLRQLDGTTVAMTGDEQTKHDTLCAEYAQIEADYAEVEELPDEINQRLRQIDDALDALENRPMHYAPEQVARAGAFVSIDGNGRLLIERGFVRLEDEPQADGDNADTPDAETESGHIQQPAVISIAGANGDLDTDGEGAEVVRPLPERLLSELSAHRTLALRDAVATNPHVAMTALLHQLVADTFLQHSARGCLEAQVREVQMPTQAEDLRDSASALAIAARHEQLAALLPEKEGTLWDWLDKLDTATRAQLLAHCVSFGVNALHEKPNPHSAHGVSQHGLALRRAEADRLARATGLDMVAVGWRPTVANYLGRVTRTHIIEAVREGAGERAAELIGHLKKADMAKEAERLLADTGWLPEQLRLAESTDAADVSQTNRNTADSDDTVELPAFLAAAEDETGDDEEPAAAAAE